MAYRKTFQNVGNKRGDKFLTSNFNFYGIPEKKIRQRGSIHFTGIQTFLQNSKHRKTILYTPKAYGKRSSGKIDTNTTKFDISESRRRMKRNRTCEPSTSSVRFTNGT